MSTNNDPVVSLVKINVDQALSTAFKAVDALIEANAAAKAVNETIADHDPIGLTETDLVAMQAKLDLLGKPEGTAVKTLAAVRRGRPKGSISTPGRYVPTDSRNGAVVKLDGEQVTSAYAGPLRGESYEPLRDRLEWLGWKDSTGETFGLVKVGELEIIPAPPGRGHTGSQEG